MKWVLELVLGLWGKVSELQSFCIQVSELGFYLFRAMLFYGGWQSFVFTSPALCA